MKPLCNLISSCLTSSSRTYMVDSLHVAHGKPAKSFKIAGSISCASRIRKACGVVILLVLCFGILMHGSAVYAQDTMFGTSDKVSDWKSVRVDLQSGAFLDSPPFDMPFLLIGRVPASVRSVDVSIVEMLSGDRAFGDNPDRVRAFASDVRALIDSTLTAGCKFSPDEITRVRERLVFMLLQRADSHGRYGAQALWNLLPWNWGKWTEYFENTERAIIAPGTIFDLESGSPTAIARFTVRLGEAAAAATETARQHALETLAAEIVSDSRNAWAVVVTRSGRELLSPRWRTLHATAVSSQDTTTERNSASLLWNRLGSRASIGSSEETSEFRVMCPPLKSDRRYLFGVRYERKLTEDDLNALKTVIAKHLHEKTSKRFDSMEQTLSESSLTAALIDAVGEITGGSWVVINQSAASSIEVEPLGVLTDRPAMVSNNTKDEVFSGTSFANIANVMSASLRNGAVVTRSSVVADTRTDNYVGVDIGILHAWDISEAAPYIGLNFYLRPVNKDAPLSREGGGFMRRFSFTCGLTLRGIDDTRDTRENLFKSQSLVLGAGYRLSRNVRAGGGILVFRERDSETYPLTRKTFLAYTPYFSASFDADVGKYLKGIAKHLDLSGD
jgi:hypothetical protein